MDFIAVNRHRVSRNLHIGRDLVPPGVPIMPGPSGEKLQVRAGADALDNVVDLFGFMAVVLPGEEAPVDLGFKLDRRSAARSEDDMFRGVP